MISLEKIHCSTIVKVTIVYSYIFLLILFTIILKHFTFTHVINMQYIAIIFALKSKLLRIVKTKLILYLPFLIWFAAILSFLYEYRLLSCIFLLLCKLFFKKFFQSRSAGNKFYLTLLFFAENLSFCFPLWTIFMLVIQFLVD